MSHAPILTVRPGPSVGGHRAPLALDVTDRLHLFLALGCSLSGTPWGLAMALVVLAVLAARRRARRLVERSAAVRGGVLAPAQRPDVLHPPGHRREAVARA